MTTLQSNENTLSYLTLKYIIEQYNLNTICAPILKRCTNDDVDNLLSDLSAANNGSVFKNYVPTIVTIEEFEQLQDALIFQHAVVRSAQIYMNAEKGIPFTESFGIASTN